MATSTDYKCSSVTLKEYKKLINQYLQTKGVTDFTKYEISIKDDNLHYKKWDYPGIEKPSNLRITYPKTEPPVKYNEWNFILDVPPSPSYFCATNVYKLPIVTDKDLTYNLTVYDTDADITKMFIAEICKIDKKSDGIEISITFGRVLRGQFWDFSLKCFLNVKECKLVSIRPKGDATMLTTVSSTINPQYHVITPAVAKVLELS